MAIDKPGESDDKSGVSEAKISSDGRKISTGTVEKSVEKRLREVTSS